MDYAYNEGVNFFDNAEAYANGKSEKLMGKIIKKLKWTRDTYIVSSKVFWAGKTLHTCPTTGGYEEGI